MYEIEVNKENLSKVTGAVTLKQPTREDQVLAKMCAKKAVEKLGDLSKHVRKVIIDFWQLGIWEFYDGRFTVILDSGEQKSSIKCLASNNYFEIGASLADEIRNFIIGEKLC